MARESSGEHGNLGGARMTTASLEEKVVDDHEEWRGVIFEVDRLDVETPDGEMSRRDIVRHPGGAAVVALRSDGMICLVRQWRVAIGRQTLEIPAGKLERGEDPLDAARRELVEETGLVPGRIEPLVTVLGSPGFTDERTRVFLAQDLVESESCPDEGEYVDVVWMNVDDVLDAIRTGEIEDGKTVSGVLMLAHLNG